jgi:hypothetical protein
MRERAGYLYGAVGLLRTALYSAVGLLTRNNIALCMRERGWAFTLRRTVGLLRTVLYSTVGLLMRNNIERQTGQ